MIPTLLATLAIVASSVEATQRGFGWATNNDYASNIGNKPLITWYHHWQDGVVPQMPSKVEFVPMFWGPAKWDKWNARVAEMNQNTPKHLMAFNEPDIESQANMDPSYAAELYMEQINPWADKGTKLGSPAIVWNLDWMNTFLSQVQSKNGRVDFICLHWYGSWSDLNGFKNYIQTAHQRFGKNIWITEVGITTSSNPSQQQVKSFMMNAFSWMDTQSYIERGGWFGAFESDRAPDDFATGKNALFNPGGSLTDLAYWYSYSSQPGKRRSSLSRSRARRQVLARDNNINSTTSDPVHCDAICELRAAQIANYQATLPASIIGSSS